MASAQPLDTLEFIDPADFQANGYPHDVWTRLRAEDPVHWYDRSPGEKFWAITKHEDIVFIGKRPDLFISDPVLVVQPTPLSERTDAIPKSSAAVLATGRNLRRLSRVPNYPNKLTPAYVFGALS